MIDSFIELVNESNNQNPPKKKVNEMGVKAPERLSGSQMGAIRRTSVQHRASMSTSIPPRSYMEIAADLSKALRTINRMDITMEIPNGTRDYYVRFPQPIVDLMKEAYQVDRSNFIEYFGKWRDVFPTNDNAIHFRTDSPDSHQRSHLPNDGIPASLRGLGLGYKMYRTLLKYAGFISSNTSGTTEKDKVWGSLLAYKANPDGTPSDDDAHAIIGARTWMAIDKGQPSMETIDISMNFIIHSIGTLNTQPDKFDMDDELLNLLPDEFLSGLDSEYLRSLVTDNRLTQTKVDAIIASRSEAERREAERRRTEEIAKRERLRAEELQTRNRLIVRLSKFGAAPDEDWDIGDFVVVKQYLYNPEYDSLPIRKVVENHDGEYTAVTISDAIRIENGTDRLSNAHDVRRTGDKTTWVKVKIDEIPDLNAVNLTATEKQYIENLLNPEVRARIETERVNANQARIDTERTANDARSRLPQTFGWVPDSGISLKGALAERPSISMFNTLKSFRKDVFVQASTFIVLGPSQRAAMRDSWGIPVFIPWYGQPNNPRPVTTINYLTNPDIITYLTNAVTGFTLEGPYVGLGLMAYPLAEVTVDDKIGARAGEHYYISGHQNTFGVIAKSDYGTVNSNRQKFIYLNVFGRYGRSVSVRLDLLRKLGPSLSI